jgi:hypothetical protein
MRAIRDIEEGAVVRGEDGPVLGEPFSYGSSTEHVADVIRPLA